jgi:WD40 repeat protein
VPGKQAGVEITNVRADPEGAMSADGTRVIEVSGPAARIHELRTGHLVKTPLVHGDVVQLGALSPDGRLAVTAVRDRTARVWTTAAGAPVLPPLRHGQRVTQARFNDDGSRLLTVSADGAARAWDLSWHEPAPALVPMASKGPSVISSDGTWTARVDEAGAVRVHDAPSGTVRHGPWSLGPPVNHLVAAPDARRLLVVADTTARVWDALTGVPLTPLWTDVGFRVPQQYVFTPDSSRVALLGPTGRLRVWNVASGLSQSDRLLPGEPTPHGLALTPDGRSIGVVHEEVSLEVRDVISGVLRLGPLKHAAPVTHAAFSADASRLAVVLADGTAVVWDSAGRQMTATAPPGHGQPLSRVAFSGDGRRLATVAEDHTVRVWDVASAQPIIPLFSKAEPIVDAQLSPDGRRLVTRGDAGPCRVWDLAGDDRPVDDLVRLTRVLSGLALDPASGGIGPVETAQLRADWLRLRTNYPREFLPATP